MDATTLGKHAIATDMKNKTNVDKNGQSAWEELKEKGVGWTDDL